MKKSLLAVIVIFSLTIGLVLFAADHIDAPAVGSLSTGSTIADITDFYAFESPSNSDNYVFICNVSGLTAPSATADVSFDDDVMYEFNIDNDGDAVEDLVIQAIFRDNKVFTYGAVTPENTGLMSNIAVGNTKIETDISTYGSDPSVGSSGGVQIFAGPRDDPFFMDFFRFVDIVNGAGSALGLSVPDPMDGTAYPTAFKTDAVDTFAGTNVLSIVIEVPKSSLGSSTIFSSWVESKMK
ncbi:MAG: DUF4331 family protein [Saprospiraceae bacterium]